MLKKTIEDHKMTISVKMEWQPYEKFLRGSAVGCGKVTFGGGRKQRRREVPVSPAPTMSTARNEEPKKEIFSSKHRKK